jgi:phosphoribosylaminoimidazolecarboxamide formyltransferase/IMP cyclohydrolase
MRILLSVSDKSGIAALASALADLGHELVASGGTRQWLNAQGVPSISVEDVTGFPEILDGRVKTLHPRIHAGILARRDLPAHIATLAAHDIPAIGMVIVNLYPFAATLARQAPEQEIIENIDIGGPSLIRAAAKNFTSVIVLVDPDDYSPVLEELAAGGVSLSTRRRLAGKAFGHCAAYDAAVTRFFQGETLTDPWVMAGRLRALLRYGENPHQRAAFYATGGGLADARLLQGKELSYNNLLDADAAWASVGEFAEPAAAIVKHGNPCGVALAENIGSAYQRAWHADKVSAFGGIVALNQLCDGPLAGEITATFTELVLAPDFSPEARQVFSQKKNLRLLAMPERSSGASLSFRSIAGGFLVQETDNAFAGPQEIRVATVRAPKPALLTDLLFAQKVCKHLRSNAIVVAAAGQTLGIGAGQTNRIDAMRHALDKAGDRARGAVLASDGFFPFADSIALAAERGIAAIIQPGGALRDSEIIAAAEAAGITMVLTGLRHFRH